MPLYIYKHMRYNTSMVNLTKRIKQMKLPKININKKQVKRGIFTFRSISGQSVLAAGFTLYIASQLQTVFGYGQYIAIFVTLLVLFYTNKK